MTNVHSEQAPFGILAAFDSTAGLYHACEKVRDAGFKKWDAHTPFPVHGLEKAMGLKSSRLPWIVLCCAILGGSLGFFMQYWMSSIDYPLVISGKPLAAWQPFMPVTFELTILFSAFGSVFGMFFLNRLPRLYHPAFKSALFKRVTDDTFFILIETADPQFHLEKTRTLLQQAGATHVEVLQQ